MTMTTRSFSAQKKKPFFMQLHLLRSHHFDPHTRLLRKGDKKRMCLAWT